MIQSGKPLQFNSMENGQSSNVNCFYVKWHILHSHALLISIQITNTHTHIQQQQQQQQQPPSMIPLSRGLGRSECRQPYPCKYHYSQRGRFQKTHRKFLRKPFCSLKTFECTTLTKVTKPKAQDKGDYVTSYQT